MKLRRQLRFHGLRRPKLRPDWNKYNLFNISRYRMPKFLPKTFFQQKWAAKAMTRAYHGEHIPEKKWARAFSRRLMSVVDMQEAYMAQFDGSEQAEGRGSGKMSALGEDVVTNAKSRSPTPYMQMTYAPQERRLDIAIFRALFASSARQAKMMCVHGAVKVNGVKMRHPAYQLNPGDMFQVDPAHVLYNTGAPKRRWKPNTLAKKQWRQELQDSGEWIVDKPTEPWKPSNKTGETADAGAAEEAAKDAAKDGAEEAAKDAAEAAPEPEPEPEIDDLSPEDEVKELKLLRAQTMEILKDSKRELSAKQKIALRELKQSIKKAMSRAGRKDNTVTQTDDVVANLNTLLSKLKIEPPAAAAEPSSSPEPTALAAKAAVSVPDAADFPMETTPEFRKEFATLTAEERAELHRLLIQETVNPVDRTKPYATPWRPRPYMSAFAFIPRYLEVNQNICAAVYLRHPVARTGFGEVPTPFPPEVGQLAFNWYLRRG